MLVSLVGIMLYKLYSSYLGWKKASVFSTSLNSSSMARRSVGMSIEEGHSDSLKVTKVSVKLSRSSTPTNFSSAKSDKSQNVKSISDSFVEGKSITEVKKSSAILNDYIEDFFVERQTMDLSPFRASEAEKPLLASKPIDSVKSRNEQSPLSSNMHSDSTKDEFIKVEPLYVVKDSSRSNGIELSEIADDIPTLNELSDLDPDTFITVASMNSEVKTNNKIMSDKVVLAMLDEAKLVCAS
jgi:hypothetical protein